MRIVIKKKRDLLTAARKLLNHTGQRRIMAFYGEMGAGKTTIIKALCKTLGTSDPVSSPTFTIVNEYRRSQGDSLYHIDLYRIKNQNELFDIGIEEYLSAGSYCFIEWPGIIEDMLPAGTVKVSITVGVNEERNLLVL
jgi:tRNA threonylcarbamoyladenosine biosynthesis protein TsaE